MEVWTYHEIFDPVSRPERNRELWDQAARTTIHRLRKYLRAGANAEYGIMIGQINVCRQIYKRAGPATLQSFDSQNLHYHKNGKRRYWLYIRDF